MCTGIYRKLQEYWDQKEWELTKLAVDLQLGGWYAAVTWILNAATGEVIIRKIEVKSSETKGGDKTQ